MFHAGRHATDASDYTSPLTAGGPTLAGEVRGYAVALTHANNGDYDAANWVKGPNGESGFSVGTSNDENDWNGYANCRAMHDYVTAHAGEGWEMRHFQAAWSCETYGNRSLDYDGNPTSDYAWQAPLRAPAGTSGWFLPSCGQLWYIAQHVTFIEERVNAVKTYTATGTTYRSYIGGFDRRYGTWSSTADKQTWNVIFSKNVRKMSTHTSKCYLRPVIVF